MDGFVIFFYVLNLVNQENFHQFVSSSECRRARLLRLQFRFSEDVAFQVACDRWQA